MSVRLTSQENRVALFDSVTGFAFGPTFEDEGQAEDFLEFVNARAGATDPRDLRSPSLESVYEDFLDQVTT